MKFDWPESDSPKASKPERSKPDGTPSPEEVMVHFYRKHRPEYATRAKLKERLLKAIAYAEGFGNI